MIGPVLVKIYHLGKEADGLHYIYNSTSSHGVASQSHIDENPNAAYSVTVLQNSMFDSYDDVIAHINKNNILAQEELDRLGPNVDMDSGYIPYTMKLYPENVMLDIEEMVKI